MRTRVHDRSAGGERDRAASRQSRRARHARRSRGRRSAVSAPLRNGQRVGQVTRGLVVTMIGPVWVFSDLRVMRNLSICAEIVRALNAVTVAERARRGATCARCRYVELSRLREKTPHLSMRGEAGVQGGKDRRLYSSSLRDAIPAAFMWTASACSRPGVTPPRMAITCFPSWCPRRTLRGSSVRNSASKLPNSPPAKFFGRSGVSPGFTPYVGEERLAVVDRDGEPASHDPSRRVPCLEVLAGLLREPEFLDEWMLGHEIVEWL